MNSAKVIALLIACAIISTRSVGQEFPRLKQPITFGLGGGFIGGQQDDKSVSVWNRILSFDYENSYIPQLNRSMQDRATVLGDQPISDDIKQLLDELIVERISLHGKNLDEFSALLKFERSQAITRSEETPEAKEVLREALNIPTDTPEPSVTEINEAFLRYKKSEIAAEKEFASRVCELLTPELQVKFFRPLSMRGTQFIIHPIGVEYLGLSEHQVSRTRKLVDAEIAFRSEKLRKAIQKNPDVLKAFGGKGTPLDKETKKQVSRKHFESLSPLTSAQIVKYLRLRGALDENGTIKTWLDKKSPDERAIGNEVLQAQLAD